MARARPPRRDPAEPMPPDVSFFDDPPEVPLDMPPDYPPEEEPKRKPGRPRNKVTSRWRSVITASSKPSCRHLPVPSALCSRDYDNCTHHVRGRRQLAAAGAADGDHGAC